MKLKSIDLVPFDIYNADEKRRPEPPLIKQNSKLEIFSQAVTGPAVVLSWPVSAWMMLPAE